MEVIRQGLGCFSFAHCGQCLSKTPDKNVTKKEGKKTMRSQLGTPSGLAVHSDHLVTRWGCLHQCSSVINDSLHLPEATPLCWVCSACPGGSGLLPMPKDGVRSRPWVEHHSTAFAVHSGWAGSPTLCSLFPSPLCPSVPTVPEVSSAPGSHQEANAVHEVLPGLSQERTPHRQCPSQTAPPQDSVPHR